MSTQNLNNISESKNEHNEDLWSFIFGLWVLFLCIANLFLDVSYIKFLFAT